MYKHLLIKIFLMILTTTLIMGCGKDSYQSDEEFIAEMRDKAQNTNLEGSEAGLIDPGSGAKPVIEMDLEEIDMGFISLDKPFVKEFPIYNRGKADLHIGNIVSECSCTMGFVDNKLIPPGESDILTILIDPNQINEFTTTKTLSIYSNDPITTQLNIEVTSKIKGEVLFSAKTMYLGPLQMGESAEQSIHMTQTQAEALTVQQITLAQGTPDSITLEVQEVPQSEWKNQELAEHKLILRVAPGLHKGVHKFTATLKLNHKFYENYEVPITITIID